MWTSQHEKCMICSKVFHYDEITETWSEIGKIKKARRYHAFVALDLSIVCPTGRLVRQSEENKGSPFLKSGPCTYIYLRSYGQWALSK